MQPDMPSDAQRQTTLAPIRRDAVLAQLQAHRDELVQMGIRYLALFGSVARDEADPESDIDILVDLERPAGLLKLGHVQNYLATLLGGDVDVVPRDSVRPQLAGRIRREALRVL